MPTIGLSMIVKNEAHTIRPCLESVQGLVSQIVIADTGCTDETIQIAQEFGATIISFPWENHFAKARNAALAPSGRVALLLILRTKTAVSSGVIPRFTSLGVFTSWWSTR